MEKWNLHTKHAGEEILRSKPLGDGTFSSNSYNLSDEVNSLKWDDLTENQDVYEYYKGLIDLERLMVPFV